VITLTIQRCCLCPHYTERLQLLYARCDFAANARSRSAPARGYLSDGAHRTRAWPPFLDEPVEIKVYDVDDVERLARWRAQEAEVGLQVLSRHEWSVKLSLGFNRPYFQVRRVTVFISRPTFVAYRYHCIWSTITGLITSVQRSVTTTNLHYVPPKQHSTYNWHLSRLWVFVMYT